MVPNTGRPLCERTHYGEFAHLHKTCCSFRRRKNLRPSRTVFAIHAQWKDFDAGIMETPARLGYSGAAASGTEIYKLCQLLVGVICDLGTSIYNKRKEYVPILLFRCE